LPVYRLIVASLLAVLAASAAAQSIPQNLDFEQGRVGQIPPGWFCPTGGYVAELTDVQPHGGRQCAHLRAVPGAARARFGNLMQQFDGRPYRGRRVRVRAAVRVETHRPGDRAQLWVREDRADGTIGFFYNMHDRPIRNGSWRTYEIVGVIGPQAARLNIGLMIFGSAEAWLDDVTIEILGEVAVAPPEPPRPVTERGLANLVAFARLLGYVRFFHPSDQAAAADWDRFAIEGVRRVEAARDAADLARVLNELFAPLAPTVRVYVARSESPLSPPWPTTVRSDLEVVMWVHQGVRLEQMQGPYASWRRRAALVNGAPPEGFADPRQPFEADLGGGVRCRVPLAVFADETGTLPHVITTAPATAADEAMAWTGDDRATRLADVVLAWNVFQHFYPYFDVIDTDWRAVLPKTLRRAALDEDARAFLDTLRRMVARLHDGHAHVIHPSDHDGWRPAFVWDWIEGALVVTYVEPDAEVPKTIVPGTVVRRIDGQPVGDRLRECEELISGSPQWVRWRARLALAAGPKDSLIELDVQTPDGRERTLRVRRTRPLGALREPRPEPIAEVRPGVWYVDIDRIEQEEFDAALDDLAAARGVVFDLRGYPRYINMMRLLGHLTDERVRSAEWNIPLVTRPDRVDMTFRTSHWFVPPRKPRLRGRIAFVTDARAISAAETLLGIVEHYRLAQIVGAPTAGTNGNVNAILLPGGYRITWTGMKVLKQDGSQHHQIGIRPTVPVRRTRAGVTQGRDELLEKAIETAAGKG